MFIKDPSNQTLTTSKDGGSTAFLANLFQCLTVLMVKIFFFMFSLNLASFSLNLLPFVLPLQSLVISFSPSFL